MAILKPCGPSGLPYFNQFYIIETSARREFAAPDASSDTTARSMYLFGNVIGQCFVGACNLNKHRLGRHGIVTILVRMPVAHQWRVGAPQLISTKCRTANVNGDRTHAHAHNATSITTTRNSIHIDT
jgi:hypothetical protein